MSYNLVGKLILVCKIEADVGNRYNYGSLYDYDNWKRKSNNISFN